MNDRNELWDFIGGGTVLVAAAGFGIWYFFFRPDAPPPAEPEIAVNAPEIFAPAPPPPQLPVVVAPGPEPELEPEEPAIPLPPLDESDADVAGGLTELFGPRAVGQFLVPENIVRNIVVTVDNLTSERVALPQRPVTRTPGAFVTSGSEDAPVLAPENFTRYEPAVNAFVAMDAKTLVSMYRGLQPLFQEAYEDLGNIDKPFTARLLEVIDHLLATPQPRAPIRLVQPSVLYKYADKNLEELSAGQRLLIRMGPDNAAKIKAKLREIEAELK